MKKLVITSIISLLFLSSEVLSEEINKTTITDHVFSGASGVAGINMASGNNHVQANTWRIGLGEYNFGLLKQDTICVSKPPDKSIDLIGGNAFSGVKGIFSINQASGSGSAEANLVSISFGKKLGSSALAQTVAKIDKQNLYSGESLDIISGAAFFESKGVIQVNQSAGIGNGIANTFHLNFNRATLK